MGWENSQIIWKDKIHAVKDKNLWVSGFKRTPRVFVCIQYTTTTHNYPTYHPPSSLSWPLPWRGKIHKYFIILEPLQLCFDCSSHLSTSFTNIFGRKLCNLLEMSKPPYSINSYTTFFSTRTLSPELPSRTKCNPDWTRIHSKLKQFFCLFEPKYGTTFSKKTYKKEPNKTKKRKNSKTLEYNLLEHLKVSSFFET